MKVLILGYGAVGSVLAKLLHEESSVRSVICADISFKEDRIFDKFHHTNVNVRNKEQLIGLLEKHMPDLVINASPPKFNVDVLGACASAGRNYLDMAAWWEPDTDKNAKSPYKIEQFDFDAAFTAKDAVGLIEAGISPGMTNLFVRECADQFDELDDVKIRLIEETGSKELSFAWSKEALLDEINSKPLIFKDGKFRIMEPFTGAEEFRFPKPFGKKKVGLLCQDEVGTIPFFIKLKSVDVKAYDNQADIYKFLYDLGLTSQEKIDFNGMKITPFEFVTKVLPEISLNFSDPKFDNAQFAFAVQASGKVKGRHRTLRYFVSCPKQKEINKLGLNANFISYPTALSAKIFAMAFHKIKSKGIIPPEALDREVRKLILAELDKVRHVVVKKEWLK
jgi:saccharopine dehydrogenase-like NADP-dependent oxidoreductase